MAYLGFVLLIIGILCSLVCIGLSIYGLLWRGKFPEKEIKHFTSIGTALVTIAFLSLVVLLLAGKYEFTAVYEVTSSQMPPYQKITAVWGSKTGSLLFWSFLLSLCLAAVVLGKWKGEKAAYFLWVTLILHTINAFFLALITLLENPFSRLWLMPDAKLTTALFPPTNAVPFYPTNGQGLNPLLRRTGMVIHPPLLYLGFILFFIPYAYGLSSLILRKYDQNWMQYSHHWVVLGWSFLSLGILLGSWWAYDLLGWGGYWGWDPVEISALMPWLTASGFLHSSIVQIKQGRLKRWNYVLVSATVLLMLFGIFLSRTGVIKSVHAYAHSGIGPAFMCFFGIMALATAALLIIRWRELGTRKWDFSLQTVPGLVNYLNILFLIIIGICLYGVTLPLTSGVLTGVRSSVGANFYESLTAPCFLLIMLLMAIYAVPKKKLLGTLALISLSAPIILLTTGDRQLSALLGIWAGAFLVLTLLRNMTFNFFKRRERGQEAEELGYSKKYAFSWCRFFIHFGFALMALGVVGSRTLDVRKEVALGIGESTQLGAVTINKQSTNSHIMSDGCTIYEESYVLTKGEKTLGQLNPSIIYYPDVNEVVSIPDIRSNLAEDIYLAITGWRADNIENSTIAIYRFPLISWLWIGGVIMVAGAMVGLMKKTKPLKAPK